MVREARRMLSLRKLPCRDKENNIGTSRNIVADEANEKNTTDGEKNDADVVIVPPPSPGAVAAAKRMGKASQRDAFTELLVLKGANGGQLKRGQIRALAKKYNKRGYPYVSEENLHYRLKTMRKGKSTLDAPTGFRPDLPKHVVLEEITDTSSLTGAPRSTTNTGDLCIDSTFDSTEMDPELDIGDIEESFEETQIIRNKGGRKHGSTIAAKEFYKNKAREALTAATQKYATIKSAAKVKGAALPKGTLLSIIKEVEAEYNVLPGVIKEETIRSRVRINNLSGKSSSRTSPLEDIEGVLVDFCIRLAKMGQGLTKEEVIELAEDLIKETEHEKKLTYFKSIRHLESKGIGSGWYKGFLHRHKGLIKTRKSRIQDSNRSTWCTYNNFSTMYDEVYEMMVKAGVAEELPEEVMMDINGNIVESEDEMYGRKTKYRITKPEQILFVDETGSNTNQKEDGLIGGQRIVVGNNQAEGACIGSNTDMHFTVLCFTSGTGEPVMCGVILKSEKHVSELSLDITLGIDITKDVLTGRTQSELYELNSDEGNGAMRGGPVCNFRGKQIPCFIATSPKASITAEILVDMLKTIDTSGVYDRSDGSIPFLLLDGHPSRTRLPFVKYITDDDHPWMVCCGVPYGTHLWQVADSSELNGCFKMQLTKLKKNYRKYKPISKKTFESTDIIPLVRQAWTLSFGRSGVARKAIAARGWGPLNYILLDHPTLLHFKKPIQQLNNQPKKSIEVNLEGKVAGSHLDAIFEDNKLAKHRQKVWEENKEKNEDRETRFKNLKEQVGLLTVGRLTKQGLHTLSRPEIYQHVFDHEQKRSKEKRMVEERKHETHMKFTLKVQEAVRRYKAKERLRMDDIKVLMKRFHVQGDSPVRKTLPQAKIQWEERGVPRLHEQIIMFGELVQEDSNSMHDEFENNDFENNDFENNEFENNEKDMAKTAPPGETVEAGTSSSAGICDSNNVCNFVDTFDSLFMLSSLASENCKNSSHVEL